MMTKRVFVSSRMDELKTERQVIRKTLQNPLNNLTISWNVFTIEDVADPRAPVPTFLQEVQDTEYYVCVLGRTYGTFPIGQSPTEREFNEARNSGKPRFIYVKQLQPSEPRELGVNRLIDLAQRDNVYHPYDDPLKLGKLVKFDLLDYIWRNERPTKADCSHFRDLLETNNRKYEFLQQQIQKRPPTPYDVLEIEEIKEKIDELYLALRNC